ncbi:MAG: bifunctional riboflavin kinase/FAD synthetase [Campylobacteraceae bacterium]|jgi:riboflavin kinase/FMN adenylyltransferase|nr:bifunctional riboflavin kinase/FAD synthetase [Campylobacteraceae bacterium]
MFSHELNKNEIHALAIGQFDGIHRAHRELFKQLGRRGGILVIDKNESAVMPRNRRDEYVSHPCFYYDLADIKNLSGEEFIALLKKDFPSLQKIVVGYDFRFGKNRMFGVEELDEIYEGKVVIVPEFCYDGISVHMSKIRAFLALGEIFQANRLLGREYSILGEVKRGQGIGGKLLFPTINLNSEGYFIPLDGVYASRIKIADDVYSSVAFVGKRISTDGLFSLEAHAIDVKIDAQEGDTVELFFVEYLRENRKFEEIKELKKQIEQDIVEAKEALKICKIYPQGVTIER